MSIKFNFQTNANTDHSLFSKDSLNLKLEAFKKIINHKDNGFFHLTNKVEFIEQTKTIYKKIAHKKNFVQVGIGGSALGPQMLVSALGKKSDKTFIVLDNIDSDFLFDELQKIDLLESVFYIVSKSGGTAETIACYAIIAKLLKDKNISEDRFHEFFIFCTDQNKGQLREHVDKNNYTSLIVPDDVGGRFSVLTHVGLLPALFFGIDIDKLYQGANNLKETLLSENTDLNPLLQVSAHLSYLLFENKIPVNETVIMPYSSKLKDFSAWFVQLWAESLGKYSSELNQNVGLTPIAAYGATDQHSQMQLFMEGPHNKLMFMLNIKNRINNYDLSSNFDFDSANKLNKFSLNELIEAEFQGSLQALKQNKRNFIQMEIDTLNEESLGELILFFESLTAIMGNYLLVDPFNQPGVELGKIYAFEYLNNLSR